MIEVKLRYNFFVFETILILKFFVSNILLVYFFISI